MKFLSSQIDFVAIKAQGPVVQKTEYQIYL